MAETIPDDAFVVRGGLNLPENFASASGATVDAQGILANVSVNAGRDLTVDELTAPNTATGYPGILNKQIGVTTAGAIRAAGGEVSQSPTKRNPYHATLLVG